jgi:hypothetical protein
MAIGKVSVFTLTITSGTATGPELDLGRGYSKVLFDITGVTHSCHFTAAPYAGGTHRVVRHAVASGMSAPQTATVGTACSGSLVEVGPLAGVQYVKLVTASTVANGITAQLYCSDI